MIIVRATAKDVFTMLSAPRVVGTGRKTRAIATWNASEDLGGDSSCLERLESREHLDDALVSSYDPPVGHRGASARYKYLDHWMFRITVQIYVT